MSAAGIVALGLLVASSSTVAAQDQAAEGPPAPAAGQPGRPIEGRYIVVFRSGVALDAVRAARADAQARGGQVQYDYQHALSGFTATLPPQALDALRRHPLIELIEPDTSVTVSDTQTGPAWGLDRIDQRALPLNSAYTYNATGSGVKAYIVDTGILASHTQFGGRVTSGYTAISDGRGTSDCAGHGTHVAGTIGATTYGVAKQVELVAVRVLDCSASGSTSGVIAGVDWITGNHQAGQPAVANLSIGSGQSSSLDTAVRNSILDGVTYVVAAGNQNASACNYSPGRVDVAITVGATTSSDGRASYSNYGTCLDLFAPGSSVTSTWHTSTTATNTISGTSMATPHVAGAAALYLQTSPTAAPSTVRDAIVNSSTENVVAAAGLGSPNRLLYSLFGTTAPAPLPPPTTSRCSMPEMYTGSLSGARDYDQHPNGTYFYAGAGTHQACLRGPAGTDFDLYLVKWSGFSWVTVAQATTTSSSENLTYLGTAGYYLWRVESYAGSGTYTFGMRRP